jgi:putative ABC transport system ATP-binding protein
MSTPLSKDSIVQVKDVHRRYQLGTTTVHALRGASLELKRGDFTALIGASGSGKSTLLNLIGCIDHPDQGKIIIDQEDVVSLSESAQGNLRNRKIGFIFQSFNLVPVLNVFENVELPLLIQPELSESERKERVMAAIRDVGLESFTKQIPDRLSGGQRQRVAIARALVVNPKLVLADEPTANLDSETANKIIDLLLELNSKRQVTFLFSTHDEKLIGRVNRIVRIQDGVIVE